MKKAMLFISMVVIYGFIGYLLHLPMAKLYFPGKVFFVSDVTAAIVAQFKSAGMFAFCGVIILTLIRLSNKSKSLKNCVASYAIWATINLGCLLAILTLKSKLLEPINEIPTDAIALEQFSTVGSLLVSLVLTCLLLWIVNKSGKSEHEA